ncbi:MAG: TIGR00730 family Rossman fold protein [bacterium]|nr:TIGR00730 family Rossman fold protein [bacterium]
MFIFYTSLSTSMFRNFWKKTVGHDINHAISRKEFIENSHRRLSTINSEFGHAFKFLKNYPHSVSFFGSSRFAEDHPCYIHARALSRRIVEELKYAVVTGGGQGVMEAANRGAFEAGGKSVGMNIVLPHEQKMNQYLTAHMRFYYFFVRKVALTFSAEVFIFFPGGFGTLDEFFELVTLVQSGKIARVPIICVGREYWQKILDLAIILRDDYKTISSGDEKIFHITDSDDEVMKIIRNTPARRE